MNYMISNGFSKSKASAFTGIARSMIYYKHRKRIAEYGEDIERLISDIIDERPSYGTRRIAVMIKRSGMNIGKNKIRWCMRHMNLI